MCAAFSGFRAYIAPYLSFHYYCHCDYYYFRCWFLAFASARRARTQLRSMAMHSRSDIELFAEHTRTQDTMLRIDLPLHKATNVIATSIEIMFQFRGIVCADESFFGTNTDTERTGNVIIIFRNWTLYPFYGFATEKPALNCSSIFLFHATYLKGSSGNSTRQKALTVERLYARPMFLIKVRLFQFFPHSFGFHFRRTINYAPNFGQHTKCDSDRVRGRKEICGSTVMDMNAV